jgi:uncharacterized membrane-anchored protein YhcB (DUF1043 family)
MTQNKKYTNEVLRKVNAELSLQLAKADQKNEALEAKFAKTDKTIDSLIKDYELIKQKAIESSDTVKIYSSGAVIRNLLDLKEILSGKPTGDSNP